MILLFLNLNFCCLLFSYPPRRRVSFWMLIYVNIRLHHMWCSHVLNYNFVYISKKCCYHMALWLVVSIKRWERNIVLPITVECEPDETSIDLLEKMMAQSTSESLPFDLEYVGKWFIKRVKKWTKNTTVHTNSWRLVIAWFCCLFNLK